MAAGGLSPIGRVDLPVDIRLLGPLEVADAAGSPMEVRGARQRALLASLASAYPRMVTTDTLVDQLWNGAGDVDDSNLQVVVSRLRSAIGPDAVEKTQGGYRLNAAVGSIDIDRFRQHTKRGRQLLTLGNPAEAAEAFRQGLAQWTERPLADLSDFDFSNEIARELEAERLDVVEWLMEAEMQSGNHNLVVGELAGLSEKHATRERLWHLLMLALYRSGRQADALRAYQRVSEILGEELGIEPSPELKDLEERILLHDPALTGVGSVEAELGWTSEPRLVTFKRGDVIVEEGAPATTVYWIEEGAVEVYHGGGSRDQVLARLTKGQYFGELASLLGSRRTASVRALEPTTVSVHSVASFRQRLGVERTIEPFVAAPSENVREAMRRGDYLSAYDSAMELIEHGDADPGLRYLAVLSLARAGATALARRRFDDLGLSGIDRSAVSENLAEDISALIPRLDKDMALASGEDERSGWATRSARGYESAYGDSGSPYLGSNAATMWLMAGDRERARSLATEVLESLEDPELYWDLVIAAECALVMGKQDVAEDFLVRAGAASDSDRASKATTLRQLRNVCAMTGIDERILTPIANESVVHYTGHRVSPEGEGGRFPADQAERVAEELATLFEERNVGVGYGSLAAGADILAAEALLARGAELHVVLPFDRDEFIRASVASAGDEWVSRFERCLASATRVTSATTGEYLNDPTLFDFCAQIAMGDALVRADDLQSEAFQVAVWDGAGHGGAAGTEVDAARWKANGKETVVVEVGSGEPPSPNLGGGGRRQVRGLVFADFAGFSTLTDAQIIVFQEEVMGRLSSVVSRFDGELMSGRTWGDGLHLVFSDVAPAASCALALQAEVNQLDFNGLGLGGVRGMRIAAHAAPVFDGWDPIGGTRLFYGTGVTKTARIEPRTPEGSVYVTHAFAALAVLSGEATFESTYVGTIQAAKGYGPVALYSLKSKVPLH